MKAPINFLRWSGPGSFFSQKRAENDREFAVEFQMILFWGHVIKLILSQTLQLLLFGSIMDLNKYESEWSFTISNLEFVRPERYLRKGLLIIISFCVVQYWSRWAYKYVFPLVSMSGLGIHQKYVIALFFFMFIYWFSLILHKFYNQYVPQPNVSDSMDLDNKTTLVVVHAKFWATLIIRFGSHFGTSE